MTKPALLLHFDGANGGTTFTDSGANNLTITHSANVTTSTAQAKFGSTSGAWGTTGTNNYYLNAPMASGGPIDLSGPVDSTSAHDWTVDFWHYPTTLSAPLGLVTLCDFTDNFGTLFRIYMTNGGTVYTQCFGSWTNGAPWTNPTALTQNAWNHIALVRHGNTVTIYLNGTAGGSSNSATISQAMPAVTGNPLFIGASYNSGIQGTGLVNGYIDEFRITKGTALWTSNFTPPTAPAGGRVWTQTAIVGTVGRQTSAAMLKRSTLLVAKYNPSALAFDIYRLTGPSYNTATLVHTASGPMNGAGIWSDGAGTWIICEYGVAAGTANYFYTSTNDGVTWGSANNPGMAGSQVSNGDTDGAGTFLWASQNPSNAPNEIGGTVDNGATFHKWNGPYTSSGNQGVGPGQIFWDGTQFCLIITDNTTATPVFHFFTAPSGFTALAGPTWTAQGSVSNPSVWNPSAASGYQNQQWFYVGGAYYWLTATGGGGYYPLYGTAANVAAWPGMTSSAAVMNNTSYSNHYTMGYANGLWFGSSDGPSQMIFNSAALTNINWNTDTVNVAWQVSGANFPTYFFYDAANATYVMTTYFGEVYAVQPGSLTISPTSVSLPSQGVQNFSYVVIPGGDTVNFSCLLGTINSAGHYVAPFTTTTVTDTVTDTDPITGATASATVTITAGGQSLSISPTTVTLPIGGGPFSFTATAQPPNTLVWSCLYGTISNGVYTPPTLPLGHATDTVTVAMPDYSLTANATVTFSIPTKTAHGKFVGPLAFNPVSLANAGTITPVIYEPAQNITIRG